MRWAQNAPRLWRMAIVLQCQSPRKANAVLKLEEYRKAESPSRLLQGSTAIAALSPIAQTRRGDGPNVKLPCASQMRVNVVTVRMGRKR